jgi:succinoglycan biosynthesis transport protein ExoP
MTSGNEQELRSVFSIIWERRALAFSITGLAILAGIGYTLFAPSIWEAKATIVFPVRTPSLLGAGSFDQSSLTATLTGGPTPLKVFAGIIESESALGMVSQMTGLSRLDVRTMRTITEETMASSITIGARSSNPDLAKSVVNDHIIALRKINDTITKPLVANDAEVIKLQLDKQKLVLAAAENALLRFQQSAQTAPSIISSSTGKDSNIIPSAGRWADMLQQLNIQHAMLDSSINDASSRMRVIAKNVKDLPASLPPVDKWRGKLTDLEYDLQIKGLSLAEEAPEMVRLRKSIDVTKSELQSEIAKYSKAANAGMVDPTGVGTSFP